MSATIKLASAIATVLATKYQEFLVKSDALNWKIAEAVFVAYESMDPKAQKKDKVGAILACLDASGHGSSRAAIKSRGTVEAMIQAVRARPALSDLSGLGAVETRKRISYSAANQISGQALAAVNPKRETHERGKIAKAIQDTLENDSSMSSAQAKAIAKKFPMQKPRTPSPVITSNDPTILSDTAKIKNTGGHVATALEMPEEKFDGTIEGISTEWLEEHRRQIAEYSKRITRLAKASRKRDAQVAASAS